MKLPKTLFCKIVKGDRNDADWLSAEASIEDCMSDDVGPIDIGVYELVQTRRVERKLTVSNVRSK